MKITLAVYNKSPMDNSNESITATIDNKILSVPLDPANRHYAEILKQVADGTITIAEAD
jgi:hypothetical protein